ncbi:nucleoside triphosphate pyrophosphohydrolase [Nocardia beijingensis]|uniref:nucleoside triphosphate pyrophosphohydrolase n=1 Tax=Nocardia beijingensis TaxID=95162 RepID=UPI00344DB8C5
MTVRGKLVRDHIPEIIRSDGREPSTRTAEADEYRILLRRKLVEEVEEFLQSEDAEEIADILEVLLALAAERGLTAADLEGIRQRKYEERGGFSARIVWLGNAEGDGRYSSHDADEFD